MLGVVALPTAPRYPALQTARTGARGRVRLFAKTGLLIKPRTSFELMVAPGWARRAALGWGNPASASSRVSITGCGHSESTGSRWLAYAGGYWVTRPACVPVIVVAHGRRRQVRIGLGTPCPGQRPPQGPTQS